MFNSIAVVNYWILQSAVPVLVILKRPVNLEFCFRKKYVN